ncbi:M15 family metallopeptidase [Nonomuraea sp. NPDC050202]|uniref:M15 family metallopeptidase n=1 Tax=Nonomuraea sp. NPDC050202 TaxID=3155035 RepID=UPI0033D80957
MSSSSLRRSSVSLAAMVARGQCRRVASRAPTVRTARGSRPHSRTITPVNAGPEESGGACCTHHPALPSRPRANRRLLAQAMSAAGFTNYPTEWWHWSYGDRYWALTTGAPAAVYGPLDCNGS